MTIKFIGKYPPYQAGDVAGFSPQKEKELVESGLAKFDNKSVNKPPVDKMERGNIDKGYTCKCGRTFDSKRGLSVHERYCKEVGE